MFFSKDKSDETKGETPEENNDHDDAVDTEENAQDDVVDTEENAIVSVRDHAKGNNDQEDVVDTEENAQDDVVDTEENAIVSVRDHAKGNNDQEDVVDTEENAQDDANAKSNTKGLTVDTNELGEVPVAFSALSPQAKKLLGDTQREEVLKLLDKLAEVDAEGLQLTNKRNRAEQANTSIYDALEAVRNCERKKRKTEKDIADLQLKMKTIGDRLSEKLSANDKNKEDLEELQQSMHQHTKAVKEGRAYRSQFSNSVGQLSTMAYDCYAESSPSFQSEHPSFNPSNRDTATDRACEIARLLANETPVVDSPFTIAEFEQSFCSNTNPRGFNLEDTTMTVDEIFRTESKGTFVIMFSDNRNSKAEVELAIWNADSRVFTAMTPGNSSPAVWKVPGDVAANVANGGDFLTHLNKKLSINDSLSFTRGYKVETRSGSSES